MKPSRSVFLSAIALVIIALIPFRAYAAAPPRVVALADVASTPVEVAITSKHLTLLHFETGEVSMVAVGDPGLVSVTVKGADVLLKALTSSGSTNAFIWLGGRYTQWTLTVRQSAKDARLIIVRDLAARSGGRAELPRISGESQQGANASTVPSGQVANGTLVGSMAAPSSPQAPSAGDAPNKSAVGRSPDVGACGPTVALDLFMRTLTNRQRELFGAFLTAPSLATLRLLFLELSAQQRCSLLALLSVPSTNVVSSASLQTPIASGLGQPDGNTDETATAEERAPEAPCGLPSIGPDSEGIEGDAPTRSDVVFSVTPQVVDGQLFLYYVLENHGEMTLLTDILRLRVSDSSGERLKFGINRATGEGYLGRLETGGVEYGLIAVDTIEKLLVLEWNLVGFRSGETHLARAAVQVP